MESTSPLLREEDDASISFRSPQILIGTAGYNYGHWRNGVFYPKGLSHTKELGYFASRVAAVEINTTFHGVPKAITFQNWNRESCSKGNSLKFFFKVPQEITHATRFRNLELVRSFVTRVQENMDSDKILGYLFQLPPSFLKTCKPIHSGKANFTFPPAKYPSHQSKPPDEKKRGALLFGRGLTDTCGNEDLLEQVCNFLRLDINASSVGVVFEFRHVSWFTEGVYNILKRYRAGVVEPWCPPGVDFPPLPPAWVAEPPGPLMYSRLHGKVATHEYDWAPVLPQLASLLHRRSSTQALQVVFFLNDWEGKATRNLDALFIMVKEKFGHSSFTANFKPHKDTQISVASMFASTKKKAQNDDSGDNDAEAEAAFGNYDGSGKNCSSGGSHLSSSTMPGSGSRSSSNKVDNKHPPPNCNSREKKDSTLMISRSPKPAAAAEEMKSGIHAAGFVLSSGGRVNNKRKIKDKEEIFRCGKNAITTPLQPSPHPRIGSPTKKPPSSSLLKGHSKSKKIIMPKNSDNHPKKGRTSSSGSLMNFGFSKNKKKG